MRWVWCVGGCGGREGVLREYGMWEGVRGCRRGGVRVDVTYSDAKQADPEQG